MAKAEKVGVVTSNRMDKTVVVSVERLVHHPVYKRAFKKTSTFMAHDEGNRCRIGDKVRILETRPLSRRKRWRVVEVLASPAQVEEIAEREIGSEGPLATETGRGASEESEQR